ncbi:MAG: hypothetical protein H6751_12160 [Candidatus Omnitrophica bacterium]|nr:hypothetical protein [Candidatus Omnitrophota bacterium]MCB9783709.1 hypothetical protein [Candidatus Omnitrophota bacterium]
MRIRLSGSIGFAFSIWALAPAIGPNHAQSVLPSGSAPEVRLVPPPGFDNDSKAFRDLFEHPEQWELARSRIDSIGYYDHRVNQFSDQELTDWFAMIQVWDKKFFIETGAVNEWCTTGQACFDAIHPLWDRFLSLGAKIDAFCMDEPYFKALNFGLGNREYAVEQVADWIRLIRLNYPDIAVGSIEPYPSVSRIDLENWIVELDNKCAQLGVRGLDFFCVDPDWRRFPSDGRWSQVKVLEDFCKARGLPFSLIYWAADRPLSTEDRDWYERTLAQGEAYRQVRGQPDEYDIQSWLAIPSQSIPEYGSNTLTRTLNDFYTRIVSQPLPTVTETFTPSHTYTPTSTPTRTPTVTPTHTNSSTPTLTPTRTPFTTDIDGNGRVDEEDLLILLKDWGLTSGPNRIENR